MFSLLYTAESIIEFCSQRPYNAIFLSSKQLTIFEFLLQQGIFHLILFIFWVIFKNIIPILQD